MVLNEKNRKILITGMICIAIVLIASGTVINYKSKKNFNTGSKKDPSINSVKITGNSILAEEYNNDGYETIKIIDYKGNQKTFKIGFYSTFYYQDGILYYSYSKSIDKMINYSTRAYDLKKDKVLWDVNGTNPFVLENGKIVLQKDNNVGDYVNDDIVVDKNSGETLVKSTLC